MRIKDEIINLIDASNHDFKVAILRNIDNIMKFYEKYPKYDSISPEEVYFILFAIKKTPGGVKVYDFGEEMIGFVGNISEDTVDVPIAGKFPIIPLKSTFQEYMQKIEPIDYIL